MRQHHGRNEADRSRFGSCVTRACNLLRVDVRLEQLLSLSDRTIQTKVLDPVSVV